MSHHYLPPITAALTDRDGWRANETQLGRALKEAGDAGRTEIIRDVNEATQKQDGGK